MSSQGLLKVVVLPVLLQISHKIHNSSANKNQESGTLSTSRGQCRA
jgi:hypothetical protein